MPGLILCSGSNLAAVTDTHPGIQVSNWLQLGCEVLESGDDIIWRQSQRRRDVIGVPMLAAVRVEYEQFIEAQTAELLTAALIIGVHHLRFLYCC